MIVGKSAKRKKKKKKKGEGVRSAKSTYNTVWAFAATLERDYDVAFISGGWPVSQPLPDFVSGVANNGAGCIHIPNIGNRGHRI